MDDAANDVVKLFNLLFDMIETARNAPFSSENCILNRGEALDLLDEIRTKFPEELEKAEKLLRNREMLLERSKRDADSIREKAIFDVKAQLADSEIVRQANERARITCRAAEERSIEISRIANDYSEETLKTLEETIQDMLNEVKQKRMHFRTINNESMQRKRDELNRINEKKDTF